MVGRIPTEGIVFCVLLVALLFLVPVGMTTGSEKLAEPEEQTFVIDEVTESSVCNGVCYTESGPFGSGGTFTYTRTYYYQAPEVRDIGDGLVEVWVPELTHRYNRGEPMVPSDYVNFALDPTMMPTSVEVTPGNIYETPLDGTLTPWRTPVRVSYTYADLYDLEGTDEGKLLYGESYTTPGLFPPTYHEDERTFGLIQQDYNDRNYAHLTEQIRSNNVGLSLYPVRYDHMEGLIQWTDELTVEVQYTRNPCYVAPIAGDEKYDMVIITSNGQKGAYQTLADYRNTTLVSTRVVTLNNIYNEDFFPLPYCRDNQEKIKYFIKAALENWEIEFVLIGGDSGVVPYRTCYINDGADGTTTISELYYVDIYKQNMAFADWNADNDTRWAEIESSSSYDFANTDLFPDLIIGRLPSQSSSDASSQISKIMNYEANAYGDPFFNEVTLMGTDTFSEGSGVAEGEYMCDYLANNYYTTGTGYSHNKLYVSLGNCNSGQYQANAGVGFLQFSDHGLKTSWANKVNTGHVTNTNLGFKLPIVGVDACLCGAFDTNRCFGEVFLSDSNGGGIAAMAASRIGYGVWGTSHIWACSGYINRMYHYSYTSGNADQVGDMFKGAEVRFCNGQNEKGDVATYKTIVEFVFFADPATYIGGIPKTTLDMTCELPQANVDPGKKVTVPFNVTNTGDKPAKFRVSADGADGPLPTGWQANITYPISDVTIAASESSIIYLDVTPPSDAIAFTNVELEITLLSVNIDNNPLKATCNVTVNHMAGMILECAEPAKTTTMDSTVYFTLDCENIGNYQDKVFLSLMGIPEGWTAELDNDEVTMNLGQSVYPIVTVTIPDKALAFDYNIEVDTYLESQPDMNRGVTLTVTVEAEDGFKAELDGPSVSEAPPGEWITFDINLTNTGNHGDHVLISVDEDALPSGWNTNIKPVDNVSIAAFEAYQVSVRVKSPADALSASQPIYIQCELGSSGEKVDIEATATISAIYDMLVEYDETEYTYDPVEEEFDHLFDITNLGNIEDDYTVTCSVPNEDWEAWSGPLQPLSAGSSISALVHITPPTNPAAGVYEFMVTVTSEDGSLSSSHNITLTVEQEYGIQMDLAVGTVTTGPGEEVITSLEVTNLGNGPDMYSVSPNYPPGWTITTNVTSLDLGPGEKASVSISVTPPATHLSGTVDIKITGTSDGDFTAREIETLKVNIDKVYGIDMGVKQVGDTSFTRSIGPIKITAGEKLHVTIEVRSTGNADDSVSIAFDPAWADIVSELEVSSYGTNQVTVTFEIPDDEEGEMDITITATSKKDNTAVATSTISLDVDKKQDNIIGGGGIPGTGGTGTGSANSATTYGIFALLAIGGLLLLILVVLLLVVVAVRSRRKKPAPAPEPATYKEPQRQEKTVYVATQSDAPIYDDVVTEAVPPPPPPAETNQVEPPPPMEALPPPSQDPPPPEAEDYPPPPDEEDFMDWDGGEPEEELPEMEPVSDEPLSDWK